MFLLLAIRGSITNILIMTVFLKALKTGKQLKI